MKRLFNPESVAIIGASRAAGKIGNSIICNMIASGYKGNIYPINKHGGEICNLPVYKSILDVEKDIDLATIVVPFKYVFDSVKACAQKKVKFLSIITSGFSEVGKTVEEQEIVKFANDHGMRILGPNIFGIYSASASMNATFGPADIKPGGVAIITQSGALGIAMIGKTQMENIGLASIVSVGNKSDLDESDLIEYMIKDDQTKVIFMYMEGVKNGERLISVLKKATRIKPIIVIKSGRSKRGAMAAASHTGSLAGADEVFSDIMKQCGVHRAHSIQQALDWCKYLTGSVAPRGENTVIITNGGGVGVLATDACEEHGIHLFDDIEVMRTAFSKSVPSFGSVGNPIDITGGASMDDYEKCIIDAFNHPSIHSIICLGCETSILNGKTLGPTIRKIHDNYHSIKPIVYSFVGGKDIENEMDYLKADGVPIYSDLEQAVGCLGISYENYRNQMVLKDDDSQNSSIDAIVDIKKINKIIGSAKKDKRNFLLADEGQELMKAAGVPMPKSVVVSSLKEAVSQSGNIGFPVVMKIVSKDILHKSDAGGVILDLKNKNEVIDAYEAILFNCKKYNPRAKIKGIEIAEMLKPGIETIIGGRYDNSFGPVIMFGQGGIYVEVIRDISFRSITYNRFEIAGMIKEMNTYPLLLGVRGESQKDMNGIIDVIIKVGIILSSCPEITDIEINPLLAYDEDDGVRAVDVRILIK
ncbi:MAG: acetate--CoA ligase family protein [Bacteriovoracaceae bacterium]|nr:acetate--CoA ligase family protein [Bacteriovoracaceae bacterium]